MFVNHVDLKDLVFLVSSILSGSYVLFASSSSGYPEGKGLMEVFTKGWVFQSFTFCRMSACGSLYLSPSGVGGGFSDADRARQWSMNTTECH